MTHLRKQVLGPWHKRLLYSAGAFLWLSGAVWLYFQYGVPAQEENLFQLHSIRAFLLKCHGAIAMVFLVVLGSVFYHIPPGWQKKSQRVSGVTLITVCGLLIMTGWGLYYLGNEQWRNSTSLIHSVVGLLLPAFIFIHVWKIVRQRKKVKQTG